VGGGPCGYDSTIAKPQHPGARPPDTRSLRVLAEAAQDCRGCDLWDHGVQTVFGEGPAHAAVMLIGEAPGDKEDRSGHVFVGPAGHLLDDALESAGLDRGDLYLTNAVKHFKWKPSPRSQKVRLHQKPNRGEISACAPWWEAELALVRPRVVGLLGATAVDAVLGSSVHVEQHRGTWHPTAYGVDALVTYHPSAVLRAEDRRTEMFAALVKDLSLVAERA
jgi:uracil-DNA glycosylase